MSLNIKSFHCFALFHILLTNHSLITYVLASVGLPMWKQILFSTIGIAMLLLNLAKFNKGFFYIIFLFLLSFIPIIGIIPRSENLYGFLYFILPFYMYPVYLGLLKNYSSSDWNNIINFLEWVGLYVSFGFVYDYFTQDFSFLSHNDVNLAHTYRPVFTLGTSSLLFIIFSAPIVIRNVLGQPARLFTYFYLVVSVVAVYFSGSRLSLILYVFFIGFYLFKVNKQYFFLAAFVGALSLLNADLSRLLNVFNRLDPGNMQRFAHWDYFYKLFTVDTLFFGPGLGSAYSDNWPHPSVHFESDLLFIYFQTGIWGVIVLFIFIVGYFMSVRTSVSYVWFLLILMQIIASPSLSNYNTVAILSLVIIAHYSTNRQTKGCQK